MANTYTQYLKLSEKQKKEIVPFKGTVRPPKKLKYRKPLNYQEYNYLKSLKIPYNKKQKKII